MVILLHLIRKLAMGFYVEKVSLIKGQFSKPVKLEKQGSGGGAPGKNFRKNSINSPSSCFQNPAEGGDL